MRVNVTTRKDLPGANTQEVPVPHGPLLSEDDLIPKTRAELVKIKFEAARACLAGDELPQAKAI